MGWQASIWEIVVQSYYEWWCCYVHSCACAYEREREVNVSFTHTYVRMLLLGQRNAWVLFLENAIIQNAHVIDCTCDHNFLSFLYSTTLQYTLAPPPIKKWSLYPPLSK
jgi:hypothetical protein